MTTPPSLPPLARWRLLLGEAAEESLGGVDARQAEMDRSLAWLYGREAQGTDRLEREGGPGPSTLTVPDWIDTIHTLFPQETIERLERDAVERFHIDELVTNIEVLQRVAPSAALLEAVLKTKHLMNPEVLTAARRIVDAVVQALMEKLAGELRTAFGKHRQSTRQRPRGASRDLDARLTVRRNLRRYDPASRKLLVGQPWFHCRAQRHLERWQFILLVDQSGSMVSSVIHSAVTAACLSTLPGIKTHFVAFDTQIVDLSEQISDPVEALLQVQLGGGTDIGMAVQYAAELIEVPARAIVIVVSDFFEGADESKLIRLVGALRAQGTRVLGLAALDENAAPAFDRGLARRLADQGAHVAAMTPGHLANWLAEQLER